VETEMDIFHVGNAKVLLVKGDITEMAADAIVNAANSSLMGGGGVDGAIHRKGGPKILEDCRKFRQNAYPNGLPTGQAVITTGGNLKAQKVIHTVGPVWRGGTRGEPDLLAWSYVNSLKVAVANRLRSVAFPSISTGVYGYPIERACPVALRAVKRFLESRENSVEEVFFVLFSDFDFNVYKKAASELFP
jgi:O-acetyl-ADP-ribose deacetylase (regulator of RNase III)